MTRYDMSTIIIITSSLTTTTVITIIATTTTATKLTCKCYTGTLISSLCLSPVYDLRAYRDVKNQ